MALNLAKTCQSIRHVSSNIYNSVMGRCNFSVLSALNILFFGSLARWLFGSDVSSEDQIYEIFVHTMMFVTVMFAALYGFV